jgi:hypothetical protein
MTVHSLAPAYVQIMYHSAYAPHVMTIPTKEWNPGTPYGDFDTWSASSVPGDEMIEDLVTLMLPFFQPTVTFDSFTIFTKEDALAPAIPRASKVLDLDGTNIGAGEMKATQATWSAKTEAGGNAKIIMLDYYHGGDFDKIDFGGLGVDGSAFTAEWFNTAKGWAGRDNARPYFFQQISITLNEKLRREYHMN